MTEIEASRTLKEKAKAAASKPAAMGEDIDLGAFINEAEPQSYRADASQLPRRAKEQILGVGVMLDDACQRAGTYVQTNNTPVHISATQEGIEVMAVSQAMKKYDWLPDYFWKAVAVDTDKYTASVELGQYDGYFFRALPGAKAEYPVQACLYLAKAQLA